MPSFFRSAAAMAMAGAAFANPMKRGDDACAAAVTGKAALGDDSLRKEHCSSFFKTIVTPAAITVTTTITDAPEPTGWDQWKRDVTVCPNEVPNYASACDESGYKSACNAFGVTDVETTITIPATTYTKTVFVPTGAWDGSCGATATVTSTVTQEVGTATVTVTKTGDFGGPSGTGFPGNCINDDKAQEFVDAFTNLLEHTSYNGTQGAPGRGYNYNISAKYLAKDFKDYSDSINWMANFPLGGVTFDGRDAFDYGQGSLQPELTMTTLNVWHSCNTVSWRWNAATQSGASVIGINVFELTSDLTQIQTNYAEFDNAAWLYSFHLDCKVPSQTSRRMF